MKTGPKVPWFQSAGSPVEPITSLAPGSWVMARSPVQVTPSADWAVDMAATVKMLSARFQYQIRYLAPLFLLQGFAPKHLGS